MPMMIASGHIAAALDMAEEIAAPMPLDAAAVVAPAIPMLVPIDAAPSATAPESAPPSAEVAPVVAAVLAAAVPVIDDTMLLKPPESVLPKLDSMLP